MISLNEPNINSSDLKKIIGTVKNNWVSTAGPIVREFEKKISIYIKSRKTVSFINATSALQIALKLIGAKKNTEVIAPTITFIAPINAIIYNGSSPIFMDADKFCNIDVNKTIEFIKNNTFVKSGFCYNKKTKKKIVGIIIVHVWGNAVYLDDIYKICKKNNIKIIEDASESFGTKYISGKFKGKFTGTVGDIGVYSFNGNKIITGGCGGALVTDNFKYAKQAKYLSTQAIDNPDFYIHNEIGYNFRMASLNAALCISQLSRIKNFIHRKKIIRKLYKKKIKNYNKYELVSTPDYSVNNHWQNIILCKKKNLREIIYKYKNEKIQTRAIWFPNHLQKPYKNYQRYKITNANYLKNRILCVPSSTNLSEKNINKIVSILNND
jgi:perosamine synthetase